MSDVKEYSVVPDGRMVRIKWSGGGQLAKELSGEYTSYREAERAIATYEANKPKSRAATRSVTNGKNQSAG